MTDFTMNQLVGQTNIVANETGALGDTGYVKDVDRAASIGPAKSESGLPVLVRIVQGSGALTPGTRVKYTSGNFGTEVEAAGAEQAHGLVDPNIASTTADGDTFLLFIEGPMDVISSAAISANAQIEGAASGKVVTTSSGVVEGRMVEAAAGADETKRAYMSFPQN